MTPLELSIPGLTIACKAWGNPENPPVIALHGWLDNANSFDKLAQLLHHDYYFIAVDLPGHGHSSHLPEGANYHFIDGIFTIIHILDALKAEKVHLLGHSMGACLGSLVAGVAPHRFLSLALIEGLGPFSSPDTSACEQLSQYSTSLTRKVGKKAKGYPKFHSAALARALKGYVSLDIAQSLCERGIKEDKGLYYWRHDRRLLDPSPLRMTEQQIISCLNNIKVKTCLIWASKGFSFNSEQMQNRMKAIKHLTIEHLDGGHHIHMEKPEAVGTLLARFYKTD
ncbi:alpha/beta fold hydrolase [Legionella worsleiensis]|uniref:Lipase A n=1 Tax=Legionella worsleiensis TaxID=45076 RepID=A0A0W1AFM9_9GAMM|nr:alpha/beta hydrolase [Legionella worsleiensis]KTD80143.1 lipase A [Legionella worsleiensis]STY31850.1 lipase A [Legionella worsleiensis]